MNADLPARICTLRDAILWLQELRRMDPFIRDGKLLSAGRGWGYDWYERQKLYGSGKSAWPRKSVRSRMDSGSGMAI
jgi:hypothetical protein